MLNLKVNSENKSIKIDMMLKGEAENLTIEITKYNIAEENGKVFIEIVDLKTNREWLNIVIETFLSKKRVEVPQKFVPLLDIAL
jgi:hypothetical protein